jgi:hypothetical protein
MPTQGKSVREPERTENRLLATLPKEEYARLAPSLNFVSLELKQPLIQVGKPIPHVFFPTSAVASLLIVMEDGAEVEAGLIGLEGMVGLSSALGLEFAVYQVICQVPGRAWRMPARVLEPVMNSSRRGVPPDEASAG